MLNELEIFSAKQISVKYRFLNSFSWIVLIPKGQLYKLKIKTMGHLWRQQHRCSSEKCRIKSQKKEEITRQRLASFLLSFCFLFVALASSLPERVTRAWNDFKELRYFGRL